MPERKSHEPEKRQERTEVTHGSYRIIAGRQADASQAIAYLGNRRIHVATEISVETAIASATAALDLRVKQLRSQRQGDVPSAAEFLEALQALNAHTFSTLAPLLRSHRHLPRQTATVADIARALGSAENAALALYIKLGKAIALTLALAPTDAGLGRRLLPLLVFATVESGDRDRLLLQLRPSFVGALDQTTGALKRSAA